jgi:hypothetical protein
MLPYRQPGGIDSTSSTAPCKHIGTGGKDTLGLWHVCAVWLWSQGWHCARHAAGRMLTHSMHSQPGHQRLDLGSSSTASARKMRTLLGTYDIAGPAAHHNQPPLLLLLLLLCACSPAGSWCVLLEDVPCAGNLREWVQAWQGCTVHGSTYADGCNPSLERMRGQHFVLGAMPCWHISGRHCGA